MRQFGVLLVSFVAILVVLYLVASAVIAIAESHQVALNTAGNVRSLDDVRVKMSEDPTNHVTVKLQPPVKGFLVNGEFEGKCVADLFLGICRKYYADLECVTSALDRTMTIQAPKR